MGNPINLFLICSLFFYSCSEQRIGAEENKVVNYLHLSHTRTNNNPWMDSIAESVDYSKYEMLWLGGDLAQLTSADDVTMNHADSIFNFSKSTTL